MTENDRTSKEKGEITTFISGLFAAKKMNLGFMSLMIRKLKVEYGRLQKEGNYFLTLERW